MRPRISLALIPLARSPVSRRRPRRVPQQNLTTSLIAVATSAGTTLRVTKSSQFLNLALARASTIAREFITLPFGSLLSSAAGAVFRLTLTATGAVALPVVAGAVAAGGGIVDVPLSWATAGTETSANASALRMTRLTVMEVPLLSAARRCARGRHDA